MKYRIYAKKTVVMAQLADKSLELQERLAAAKQTLEDLAGAVIFVPVVQLLDAENLLDMAKADYKAHEDLVALVASHDPPEVMVEFED